MYQILLLGKYLTN